MIARGMRGVALGIAIAAAIDPAITAPRSVRPEVAVVPADSARDAGLADRVDRLLRDDFRVLRASFAGAAATVVTGDALPGSVARFANPVFAVETERRSPHVTLETVTVPTRAPLDGAVAVDVTVRVEGARSSVDVVLEAGGVAVDRTTLAVDVADTLRHVRLTYVPAAPGPVPIRITASVRGEMLAAADAVVTIVEERWAVLFHDTRPSWQSTFVRRTLERDARFDIAFRVITSRSASITAGEAPLSLADADALMRFDAVVVGAPDGLVGGDVAALERYMRRRGGSVVLLLDSDAAGAYERLTGASAWTAVAGEDALPIAADGGGDTLRATALRFPRALPPGAIPLSRDGDGRAVVWESPVGAGRVVVSGALDAWRLRDPAASDFDAFWRAHIAAAAAAAPPAIVARLEQPVLRPGEEMTLTVALRDLVLADASAAATLRAELSAVLAGANVMRPLRVLPEGSPGRLRARVRAPESPGLYHVRVTSGDDEAEAALLVARDAALARPDRTDLLRTWTAAHGGATLAAADAGSLPAALARVLPPVRRSETWHPMRSPWWIVPFALLLGAEWWWRRRRGRA